MIAQFKSLAELKNFITERLCEQENLLADQFPLREENIVQRGRVCGKQYILLGPRNIRLSAVWSFERRLLYLFDARGMRYETIPVDGHHTALIAAH